MGSLQLDAVPSCITQIGNVWNIGTIINQWYFSLSCSGWSAVTMKDCVLWLQERSMISSIINVEVING